METRVQARLVREAKEGSTEALDTLFGHYGERLLALIRLRLGPDLRRQLESRDVMQQTLLKAFRHIDQFDTSEERSLMAWLGGIARHEILDQAKYHRRAARDAARNVPIEKADDKAADQLRTEVSRIHLRRQSRLLEQALESLSEEHRELILLHRFEELSFPEIGRLLGKSADACRMLHTRAMAGLALKMKELAEGASPT